MKDMFNIVYTPQKYLYLIFWIMPFHFESMFSCFSKGFFYGTNNFFVEIFVQRKWPQKYLKPVIEDFF